MNRPTTTRLPSIFAGCVLAVALGGCQMRGDVRPLSSEAPPPPVFVDVDTGCHAPGARYAVGRQITAPLLEDMRVQTGARFARTVKAGEPAGEPADGGRLNVEVDAQGVVKGARCG